MNINIKNLKYSLLISILLFFPTVQVVSKFFGTLFLAFYLFFLFISLLSVFEIESRSDLADVVKRRERLLAAAWLGLMAAALAILYPVAQSGLLGRGSDRDEALMLGVQALLDGRYPYYERTQFGGRLTPMPGAFLLGAPFHLAGSVVAQNLFYGAICVFLAARVLAPLRTRWLLLPLLTLGNAAYMQDYTTGGDFILNALYVAVAMFFCARAVDDPASGVKTLALSAAFLGLVICVRPVYVVAAVAVVAYAAGRRGWRWGAVCALTTGAVAALVIAPFALYDWNAFVPSNVINIIPAPFAWARYAMPAAAILVSLSPLFMRMDVWGLLTTVAVALGVMLIPGAFMRGTAGYDSFAYCAPVGLYGAMALAARWSASRQSVSSDCRQSFAG